MTRNTPIVLMGYLNPIEAMGADRFAEAARAAGVDGVITVDLPPEETDTLVPVLQAAGLDPIFLAATNHDGRSASQYRIQCIGIYLLRVLEGCPLVPKALDISAVAAKLTEVRQHSDLPLGVGFGVATPEAAAAVAAVADAVVVGSALVRRLGENADAPERGRMEVANLLSSMRHAMDAA